MKMPPTPLDYLRFVVVVLLALVTWPLTLLFYLIRSAWRDAPQIGWFLQPTHICEHGVDRVRRACLPCNKADEIAEQAAYNQQVQDEIRANVAARRAAEN